MNSFRKQFIHTRNCEILAEMCNIKNNLISFYTLDYSAAIWSVDVKKSKPLILTVESFRHVLK
jgi:hypothetical protein